MFQQIQKHLFFEFALLTTCAAAEVLFAHPWNGALEALRVIEIFTDIGNVHEVHFRR